MSTLPKLLTEIRACRLCEAHLALGPRPVLQAGASARILIASQAPGRKVHASGLPFTDASGDRLRDWLGMPPEVFYDASQVAIAPMGFCYPGTGRSGHSRRWCRRGAAIGLPWCLCRTPARATTAGCAITPGLRPSYCLNCGCGLPLCWPKNRSMGMHHDHSATLQFCADHAQCPDSHHHCPLKEDP